MSRNYAKALTKKMLQENFGITNVTPDGQHVYVENGELRQIKIKSGKKVYMAVFRQDRINGQRVPGKHKKVLADGTVKYYKTNSVKQTALGVHRLVYIWNVGDQVEGMVIDHIDNNPLNNDVTNLQMITPTENITKDRQHIRKLKASPKGIKYMEDKLAYYTNLYEEAKINDDQDAAHKYRTSISNYKAQIRDYYEHKAEYEAVEQEKALQNKQIIEENSIWNNEYHIRAARLRALKNDIDYHHSLYLYYKNDPTMAEFARDAWKESIENYKNFKNDK